MVQLNLSAEARAADIQLTDGPQLTNLDRGRAIATWRGRMVNEHISARVFAALIPQMMKAGLSASWQERVAGMVQDELRHGRQCAAIVHALGGEAVADLPALPDVPMHEEVSALEGFLRNVISISCMSETVAVSLIRAEQREVAPPEMEAALAGILSDEVQHARFGWEVLRELAPSITSDMRDRLNAYLQVAFQHLHDHEFAHLPIDQVPTTEAAQIGVCDGRDARRLFLETVDKVIVPGLEEHGLSAQSAWDQVRS